MLPHRLTSVAPDDDARVRRYPAAPSRARRSRPGAPRDFVSRRPFTFKSGQTLPGFTLRYETYGQLNATRDNAILICHALSGDHHCAGWHSPTDRKPGWWNNLIGPGKAVDTNRFFVICANVLGGCQGSTGPSSINPATGRPYGIAFPFVTIRDMVRAQKLLLDHLGVAALHAVIGGSMGGMTALLFAIEFPALRAPRARDGHDRARKRAGDRLQRGRPPGDHAGSGLEPRRLPARRRPARRPRDRAHDGAHHLRLRREHGPEVRPAEEGHRRGATPYTFDVQFEVESYLRHQGQSFINRFDANSYLYITRALDQFDLAHAYGSLEQAFAPVQAETLVVGFTSDWLFPPEQNRAIALALLRAGKRASYAELATDLGHDSFLLESEELYALVRGFLEREAGRLVRLRDLTRHDRQARIEKRTVDMQIIGDWVESRHPRARPRLRPRRAARLSRADEAGVGRRRGPRFRQDHRLRPPRR